MEDVIETEITCAHCGGTNIGVAIDEDNSTGYRTEVYFCYDCNGRAD